MSTFIGLPGSSKDYKDAFGPELIRRKQFWMVAGWGGNDPAKCQDVPFAGASRSLISLYLQKRYRPVLGDRIFMKLRGNGRIYSGRIVGVAEVVHAWTPSQWEWEYRTPLHKKKSEAHQATSGGSPQETYWYVYDVDWTECPNPTREQIAWVRAGARSAINKRVDCPF
jgi:hypothetical protein